MKETIEFRVPEDSAVEYLPDDLGENIGYGVRRIITNIDNPWVARIGRLDVNERNSKGLSFFTQCTIHRKYTRRELSEATLLHVNAKKYFEPAAEECGTHYDDSIACPVCETGAIQDTPLYLPAKRLPNRVDVAKTIADEMIFSRRLAQLFRDEEVRGVDFEPVRLSDKKGALSDEWFQPIVRNQPVHISQKTKAGSTPFDETQYGKCDCGDLIGLNLISEPYLEADSYDGSSIVLTRQMTGVRRGLLRPHPLWLLTPRLWSRMEEARIKGFQVERAHLIA